MAGPTSSRARWAAFSGTFWRRGADDRFARNPRDLGELGREPGLLAAAHGAPGDRGRGPTDRRRRRSPAADRARCGRRALVHAGRRDRRRAARSRRSSGNHPDRARGPLRHGAGRHPHLRARRSALGRRPDAHQHGGHRHAGSRRRGRDRDARHRDRSAESLGLAPGGEARHGLRRRARGEVAATPTSCGRHVCRSGCSE